MEVESRTAPSPVPSEEEMKYIENIEFSNACREFYYTRLSATENFLQDIENDNEKSKKRKTSNSIDNAMEKLRREMVSFL